MGSNPSIEKRVFDLNVLAIYLVKGHPGFSAVAPNVEQGLRGSYILLILYFLPVYAFWIMTKRWALPAKECSASIEHFLNSYDIPRYPSLNGKTILLGFRLANELKHDVFDCVYLAIALQEKAISIITTGTDFEKICNHLDIEYVNPVPKEILKRFKEQNR